MTPEEKVERIKELFEKAVKYSEGLPPEDRNVNRTVGYYDCLVKVSGRVAELEKEVERLKGEIEKRKALSKYATHEWALANGWIWSDYEDIYYEATPFGRQMNKTEMWKHFLTENNL